MIPRTFSTAVVLAMLLAGGGRARADGETPADDVAGFVKAVRENDAPRLRELATRQAEEAWEFADELIGAGDEKAAEAFAGALPDDAGRALREHLASIRGKAPPGAARSAFRVAVKDAGAGRWRSVVELLGGPQTESNDRTILAVRIAGLQGDALDGLNRRGEASAAYGRAGATARAVGWSKMALATFERAAALAYDAYLLAAARGYLEQVRALQEEGRDAPAVAATDHNLGAVVLEQGDIPRALRYFREALGVYEQIGDLPSAAHVECSLADAYDDMGDYARAKAALQRVEERIAAATAKGRPVDPVARAEAAERRGVLALHVGQPAAAREDLESALGTFRASEDARGEGQALGNLALVHLNQGRWADAIARFDDARQIFERIDEPHDLASALLGIAQVHIEAALGAFRRARSADARGDGAGAADLREQALRACEDARVRVAVALRKDEEFGLSAGIANSRGTLGQILLAEGRAKEALKELEFARDEAQRLRVSELYVEQVSWLAKAHFALGDLKDAVEAVKSAWAADSDLYSGGIEEYRARSSLLQADVFETGAMAAAQRARTGRPEDRQRHVADVHEFLEMGRARSLLRSMGGRAAVRHAAVPAALLAREAAAAGAKAEAFARYQKAHEAGTRDTAERWKAYEAARDVEGKALRDVDDEERRAAGRLEPPRIESVEDVGSRLQAGDAFVEYGLFPDVALALVIERKDGAEKAVARVVELPGIHGDANTPAEVIRGLVARLALDAEDGPKGLAATSALKATLLEPLALAPGTRRLLVSPHAELSYVPFALLVPDEWSVAYEPSGTTLNLLREDQEKTGHDVLALGNPDYQARGGDSDAYRVRGGARLLPLPLSRAEVEAATPGKDDVRLLGRDATENGLRLALEKRAGPRWHAVHFACHGLVDVERPTYSSLAVTPGGGDDGFLTALEIFRLKIPTDVAVLSACRTGRGQYVRGEGIVGLARAFMYAGAPRVLVSLWDADDEATKELMVAFYRSWTKETGAARALRLAQEHVRTFERVGKDGKKEIPWADPKYWAPWVLWGLPD